MATRRPKVPRADALGAPSTASRRSGTGPGADGADVIKAEFGGTRTSVKPSTPAAGTKAPAGTKGQAASKGPGATNGPAASKVSGASKASGTSRVPGGKASDGGPAKAGAKAQDKPGAKAEDNHDLNPVPAKAFSGRMLALAVVMIAITIMLAPTVKIFLEKRAEISALEAEIASKEAEQSELNKQLSRWQDPNYVKQQARDRINMVMPGETGYWVFGGEEAAGTPGGRTGSGSSANPENLPWVDALWESIRRSATD